MDDDAVAYVEKVKDDPNMDFVKFPDLYIKLRHGGFLVEDGKDDDLIRILKMRRLSLNYSDDALTLTIALTKDCNFDCDYCFERNRVPSSMSDDTEDKLINFIERHKLISKVSVVWYGGEPLLEFERMRSLSEKIQALGKSYQCAIITNGYCLTPEVISNVKELKLSVVQITIDGTKETHDNRRHLIGGGQTYDRIIGNIDSLMKSEWEGLLSIRVNVDDSNSEEFAGVHSMIKAKYPEQFGKHIQVYPGFIHNIGDPQAGNCLDSRDKGRFFADIAKATRAGDVALFPRIAAGGCTMTKKNAYVVGPDGELYKCWDDVGDENGVIGSVACYTNWNMSLVAEGMVGASYLEDDNCLKCFFFPICDGGCPKARMHNKRDNGCRDTCSYFKENTKELLELHYEQKIQ